MFFGYFAFVYNVSEVASIISNLRNIDAERDEDTAVFKRMVKKCRNKLKHNCHISIMQWYFNFDILHLVVETGGEV